MEPAFPFSQKGLSMRLLSSYAFMLLVVMMAVSFGLFFAIYIVEEFSKIISAVSGS